jgi:hypothetical protein
MRTKYIWIMLPLVLIAYIYLKPMSACENAAFNGNKFKNAVSIFRTDSEQTVLMYCRNKIGG